MAIPANIEQLNIGQLVTTLSQLSAAEFIIAVQLLAKSNRGVDWRLLLGAITAENAVVAADAGAATSFGQVASGIDRVANLDRFESVDPRGRTIIVPPAGDLWVAGAAQSAAGATLTAAALIPALAGRTAVITSLVWMVVAGAAAQASLDLIFLGTSLANPLPVLRVAVPANDSRVVSASGLAIVGSAVNTAVQLNCGAPAANTTQALYVAGYYQ